MTDMYGLGKGWFLGGGKFFRIADMFNVTAHQFKMIEKLLEHKNCVEQYSDQHYLYCTHRFYEGGRHHQYAIIRSAISRRNGLIKLYHPNEPVYEEHNLYTSVKLLTRYCTDFKHAAEYDVDLLTEQEVCSGLAFSRQVKSHNGENPNITDYGALINYDYYAKNRLHRSDGPAITVLNAGKQQQEHWHYKGEALESCLFGQMPVFHSIGKKSYDDFDEDDWALYRLMTQ